MKEALKDAYAAFYDELQRVQQSEGVSELYKVAVTSFENAIEDPGVYGLTSALLIGATIRDESGESTPVEKIAVGSLIDNSSRQVFVRINDMRHNLPIKNLVMPQKIDFCGSANNDEFVIAEFENTGGRKLSLIVTENNLKNLVNAVRSNGY